VVLNPFCGEWRIVGVKALPGLVNREPLAIGPDELASLGINIHVLQQRKDRIRDVDGQLAVRLGSADLCTAGSMIQAARSLWAQWYSVVAPLRAACSRQRSFLWLLVALAGICVRRDLLGVTSLSRRAAMTGGSISSIHRRSTWLA